MMPPGSRGILLTALLLAGCGSLDLEGNSRSDSIACTTDDDCPEQTICYGTPQTEMLCSIPCIYNEQCPENNICTVLVGDSSGVRVCALSDE